MKDRKYFKMFTDILKEDGRYSQGRVYLLWSVFAYYITLGFLLFTGIRKSDINVENFRMIVEALEYAMTLFGGYVFGGKFITAYQAIKSSTKSSESTEDMG
jgi:ABC-type iron transport system FetAB ATPase subunit